MSKEINERALLASEQESERASFINDMEKMILKEASLTSRRYITKSDDEWSIALNAFSRAIDIYSGDRGDFLPFAGMLIKRSLIDYYRTTKNSLREIPIAPHVLEGNGEPEEDPEGAYAAVVKQCTDTSERSMREEIESANEMLAGYGFRFFDLTECSPHQDRTKLECAKAIRLVLSDESLLTELRDSHRLPVKDISKESGVSKKLIDRYRRYIIMSVLILDGDYPQIAEYLKYIR